jgi:hypothetical protein
MRVIYIQLFVLGTLAHMLGQTSPPPDEIDYKIVVPQLTYNAGATATVWLLIVNRGTLPIYISRHFVRCSNPSIEFVETKLLDKQGHQVDKEKQCAVEIYLKDPIAALADTRFWIELRPGEAYGADADIGLPTKKGKYRLVSELFPPGFYEEQKEALANRQMRVLRSRHIADSVVINVR